jgi:hypothetical protein
MLNNQKLHNFVIDSTRLTFLWKLVDQGYYIRLENYASETINISRILMKNTIRKMSLLKLKEQEFSKITNF